MDWGAAIGYCFEDISSCKSNILDCDANGSGSDEWGH